MTLPKAGAVFQFRKGPDVQLARVSGAKGARLTAVDEDGKPLLLAPDRILQVAGDAPVSVPDAETRDRLRAMRDEALDASAAIELELLWETVRGNGPTGKQIGNLAEVYLGRSGSVAERLGLGYALCRDTIYFKQKGMSFHPRMEAEVLKRREQREAEHRAKQARARFLNWAREALVPGAPTTDPPADACEPLVQLTDLAVRAELAPRARQTKALLREIAEIAPKGAPNLQFGAEGAWTFLCRVGVFGPHENLSLLRLGIPTDFEPEVLAAANAVAPYRFDPEREPWRRDLRDLEVLTVDNTDTLDRDDGFSIVPVDGGGFQLLIHIADPTTLVRPGDVLDEEASRRATTVYLPTGRYPMIPRALSEGLLSLNADGERPTLTIRVDLDDQLAITGHELFQSVIRVTRNMSYEEADAELERGETPLAQLGAIADALAAARAEQGALDLNSFDREVRVCPETFEVTILIQDSRSKTHAAIAELAVLANRLMAELCQREGIPAIYRTQSPPKAKLPLLADLPNRTIWVNEVRKRLGRSDQGLTPGPHATLGIPAYLQATSPIRRFQDLVHIRQITAFLRKETVPYSAEKLREILGSTQASTNEVGVCARETIDYWLYTFLKDHADETFTGMVLGKARDGRPIVLLDRLGMRQPVGRRSDSADAGDRVSVRVQRVDPRRGELKLVLAKESAAPAS